MKKIILILILILPASSLLSQRKLSVKLKEIDKQQFLVVKYKGKKSDFFDPITSDFINPVSPKDSVRLMSSFDYSLSGVMFFLSDKGDSTLYQVWDITKIDTKLFNRFYYSIYDYTSCISNKSKRLKLILPVSINPVWLENHKLMLYRIEIKNGICGETIEWLEAEHKITSSF